MMPHEILAQFAAAESLPSTALRAAVGEAGAIAPSIAELAERVRDGAYLLPEEQNILFYGTYALAAAQAKAFYRPLVEMLHVDEDLLEAIFGDAITENLSAMLVGLFDGDTAPLYALLEGRRVGSYVKWGTFEVLAQLVHDGRAPRQPFVAFLDRFERERLVDADDSAWQGWQDAIGRLRIAELKQRVIDGWHTGRNDLAGEEDCGWWVKAYAAVPGSDEDEFAHDHATPFDDPVRALSWADLSGKREQPKPGDLIDPGAATALSPSEIGWLEGFLISDHVPESTLTMEMVDGFFTALAVTADGLDAGRWLPLIWSENQRDAPTFDSDEQEALVVALLTRHRATIGAQLATGLPRRLLLMRGRGLDPASAWRGGFLRAVALAAPTEIWREVMDQEAGEIAFGAVMMLGTGAYESDEDGEEIELSSDGRERLIEKLPEVIADIYCITHPDAPARPRSRTSRPGTYRREGRKIGRNDSCPCGSGLKFKACCINKAEMLN